MPYDYPRNSPPNAKETEGWHRYYVYSDARQVRKYQNELKRKSTVHDTKVTHDGKHYTLWWR